MKINIRVWKKMTTQERLAAVTFASQNKGRYRK